MNKIQIRNLTGADWSAVKLIYESGIRTGFSTFETAAPSWQSWDEAHLSYGRLVAIIDNVVVGWASLSPVSSRCVYGGVAEVSVYVSADYKKRGIGQQLLEQLILDSEQHNIWTLQSSMFRENIGSVKLHEKVGFRVIGYREKVGKLNGSWRDNIILERRSEIVGVD
ncbi:MAG: GNAT family N-acetyltransferase [Saprospiraceae bacterium]